MQILCLYFLHLKISQGKILLHFLHFMHILHYIRKVKTENAEMNDTYLIETLPNGLTADQVKRAKEIFDQVPITKVCKGVGVNISTVYRVLSGESSQFDKFTKVLIASKKQIAKTKKTEKQLPI